MKIKLLGIIIILTISDTSCAQLSKSSFDKKTLNGCWVVKDHLHDEEASYSTEKLNEYSKKTNCFDNMQVKIFDDIINSPIYSFKIVSATEYLWNTYNADKKYFQIITDKLLVINIKGILVSKNKSRSNETEYSLFYDGRYLFLYIDGATFRFQKVK